MSGLSKKFTLVMVFVFAVSVLFLVEPSTAPVTTPSNPSPAPEIVSVVFHHNPIWHPPTYTTNPYTGEVTVTSSGYWRPNGTMEITIKNRLFTSYTDKNGNYINVYYAFFTRSPNVGVPWDIIVNPSYAVYQSDSEYTVFTLRYDDSFNVGPDLITFGGEGAMRDFRVQAVVGYFQWASLFDDRVFEGEGSEWVEFTITVPVSDDSGTQTPIVPSTPSSPSMTNPNSTQSVPQQTPPQFNMIVVRVFVALCIIVVLMVATVYFFKQRKPNSPPNQT